MVAADDPIAAAAEVACRLVRRMRASIQMSCHCRFAADAREAAMVGHLSPPSTAVAVAAGGREAADSGASDEC